MSALTPPPAIARIVAHIRRHLPEPPSSASSPRPPLFVAIQGPQGSGKTFLTKHVAAALAAGSTEHVSLRIAALSIDDLYLSHDDLTALADARPTNKLLQGRGQPGTHDVRVGLRTLQALKFINSPGAPSSVKIPFFDKSLFGGEGDRVPETEWITVERPLDVVLFEGWCVGFCPQSRDEIERRMGETPIGLDGFFDISQYTLGDVLEVNELLVDYIDCWNLFDLFVQIVPAETSPYVHIYKWRLQQEHVMKARNGGRGMSDEQVKAFVDRYIPGYHFFGSGILQGGTDPLSGEKIVPPWLRPDNRHGAGRLLRVTIGEGRELLNTVTQ
ncbi:hypothetical protein EWM64_g3916 [Hericium alpestre]|uniref:P-loop containing nucleoside triphosphate hydrolase protein n=1 Tax=Hericium alpestre TaxID=135208 RepID=A0A4Z0A2J9_9AGAM|nr:hypothetical protein EWM64_g3916 [Hericium alpestre]